MGGSARFKLLAMKKLASIHLINHIDGLKFKQTDKY